MIDMATITIRRVNRIGVAYGQSVPHEDLPFEVLDAVECEIIETDEDTGEISVGGQRYRWQRN